LTKIAVGIFAGGIVFATLLPELRLDLGFAVFNSFWIGSVAVIVLTGMYTILGGMRAVAYTEAMQTLILVFGSVLVTFFGLRALGGWEQLREVCGSDMFNLWKPLVPAGMEGTWAPVKESGRIAWYFNSNYPWLGMLFCAPIIGLWYWCTDQYIVQRTLGAPNEREARRGTIFAAFLKLLPVFIFIIPGMICFALAKTGQVEALGRKRQADCGPVSSGFSADGQARIADGDSGLGRGRPAGGPDEFTGRRVQCQLDAVHDGPVSEVPSPRVATSIGMDGPRRHHGDGRHRTDVDSRDSGRPWVV
jgi:SSS family solute:Na+ symporter